MWRARYRSPDGRQRERRFDRKVDAQRWLDEQTTQHVTGTYVDPTRGRVTVGDWAGRWLDGKGNLKASTRDRYAGILATHVRPAWWSVRLDAVTHDRVQAWTADLAASGLSAASVVKTHRVLSMVLAYAVRSRRLASNPADGVTLPRVSPAEKRYLRPEQVADLAERAGPGRRVVLVLAYTGLRWGELAALRVSRVDLLRRRIHVAESVTEVDGGRLDWGLPKDHERRWVPVPRFLVDDLAEQVAGKAPDDLVFTSPHGAVLRVGGARRSWFDRAAVSAGLDGLNPPRAPAHGGQPRRVGRCERQGGTADARPREGVDDPRRVRRTVRRRPGSSRRSARRNRAWLWADCGRGARSPILTSSA